MSTPSIHVKASTEDPERKTTRKELTMKRKDLEKKIAANRREASKLAKEIEELTEELYGSRVEHFNIILEPAEETTKESLKEECARNKRKSQAIEINTDERKAFMFGYFIGWVEVMAQIQNLADSMKENDYIGPEQGTLDIGDHFEILNKYLNDIYQALVNPMEADEDAFEMSQTSLQMIELILKDVDEGNYPF